MGVGNLVTIPNNITMLDQIQLPYVVHMFWYRRFYIALPDCELPYARVVE